MPLRWRVSSSIGKNIWKPSVQVLLRDLGAVQLQLGEKPCCTLIMKLHLVPSLDLALIYRSILHNCERYEDQIFSTGIYLVGSPKSYQKCNIPNVKLILKRYHNLANTHGLIGTDAGEVRAFWITQRVERPALTCYMRCETF